MYSHHLEDMVNRLAEAGVLMEADKDKAMATLDSYWENKIAVSWSTEDIITLAKQGGKVVTEEQAGEILQSVLHHHDCEYGITWETLRCGIEGLGDLPDVS